MEAVPQLSICLVGIPHWGCWVCLGDGKGGIREGGIVVLLGQFYVFFYWNSDSMLLASNNRMALSDCRWILIFLIRVSHITPFFELSLALLTTHAIGL